MRVSGIPYIQGRNAYSDPDGTKYGIAIHNTSNDATAEAEASYATRRTDGVSSHFYVDSDSMIQSLDTASRAGHAGSSNGNNHAVAVEITGVNSWSRQQWLDRVAWDLLGRSLAQVCKAYGIQPRRASVAEMRSNPKVKAFYSHDDMRQAWGGTDHTDPGPNFPWDRLLSAVSAALDGGNAASGGDDMTSPTLAATHDRVYTLLVGPTVSPYPEKPTYLMGEFAKVTAKIDALATIVQHLADVITSGSGSADVAAILAGVDTMLDAAAAELKAEMRDTAGDLAEGGAAQVRADTDA